MCKHKGPYHSVSGLPCPVKGLLPVSLPNPQVHYLNTCTDALSYVYDTIRTCTVLPTGWLCNILFGIHKHGQWTCSPYFTSLDTSACYYYCNIHTLLSVVWHPFGIHYEYESCNLPPLHVCTVDSTALKVRHLCLLQLLLPYIYCVMSFWDSLA